MSDADLFVRWQVVRGGAGPQTLAQQQIRVRDEAETSGAQLRQEALGRLHPGTDRRVFDVGSA